jgi:hypothetical protein
MDSIRVALVGLGPIGIEVGKALRSRGVTFLGAADPAPEKAGRDLGDLLGGEKMNVLVCSSAGDLYSPTATERLGGDIAVICTGSRMPAVAPQIEQAIRAGLHVVSTCEELSDPKLRHADVARRLDAAAREHKVGILGTGVNPGLVMDRLALAIAGACVRVDRVFVKRVVDAAKRRGPLRAKVGAGLTREEFEAGVAAGKLSHVGLPESAALLAEGLGWPANDIRDTIEPVVARVETEGIARGRVLGLHQTARVHVGDRVPVELDLTMAVGVPDPGDRIVVEGDPPLDAFFTNGFHGDRATVGCVVNALPFVAAGPPGLQTVVSLPLFGLAPVRSV